MRHLKKKNSKRNHKKHLKERLKKSQKMITYRYTVWKDQQLLFKVCTFLGFGNIFNYNFFIWLIVLIPHIIRQRSNFQQTIFPFIIFSFQPDLNTLYSHLLFSTDKWSWFKKDFYTKLVIKQTPTAHVSLITKQQMLHL